MEWIANMEGPVFLALYAVFILVVLLASYWTTRSSSSGDKSEPLTPVLPNPYEMAYLRGGEIEIGKLALIELARRGYIQQRGGTSLRGGKVYLRRSDSPPSAAELSEPQRRIFELVGTEDKPVAQLLKSRQFQAAVEEIKKGFIERLHQDGLIVGDFKRAKVLFVSALLITGLGGYKLAVALAKGKYNVGFLILFAVLSMFALWAVVKARRTWRGDKYFRNTQEAYRFETSDVVFDVGSAKTSDMLLHVGLFGAPILFGTTGVAYATMLGLDPSRRYGDSGCSSGCGSSSGGGGDGGSCGGGCGGCGGE